VSTMEDYLKFARIFVENGSPGGIQSYKRTTRDLIVFQSLSPTQRHHSKLMGRPCFKNILVLDWGVAIVTKESPVFYLCLVQALLGSVGWPGAYVAGGRQTR